MPDHRYADVAIPNIPRDTLTYAVPEDEQECITTGVRVVVPLGRRSVMGFVVRLHDDSPEYSLKFVQRVVDSDAILIPNVMQLCSWISQYYCCTLGDAIKAALPKGMGIDSTRHVSLCTDDDLLIDRVVGRSKIRAKLVDALRTGEVMSEEQLRTRIGTKQIATHLRELTIAGIVTIETTIEPPAARPMKALAVRLSQAWTNENRIIELLDILEKRAPKQVNILTLLWKATSTGKPSMRMAELVKAAHATSAQVRSLEHKGIVEVIEEEVNREFLTRFEEKAKNIILTNDQREVLEEILPTVDASAFEPMLLHGVTASGKTQVYIEAIRHALQHGKTALVLVPEISLTPQLTTRFRRAFASKVAVMHSRMSMGERYDSWRLTLRGEYSVVVGVRSAVFAPMRNLGIIIVDEEHDGSYKQSDTDPRYNGRDAAVMRGFIERVPVLLGSATPSTESWHNAAIGKYRMLHLKNRIDDARLPAITPVDMAAARRSRILFGCLSKTLLDALRERISRGEKAILLHNRRGFAPHLECRDCGYVDECEHCSISLTFHKAHTILRCHYCGYTRAVTVICPQCGGTDLDRVGIGTQRVEEDLREAIPEARVLRMDADSTRRKGSHDMMLTAFGEGEYDILLGTQMVSKGLDFESVTLVGIISAEQSLLLPDFRAAERTVQLLLQVAGRSGRGKALGEVLIQSMQPEHPVFDFVYRHDYEGFLERELQSRRTLSYPPFTRLVCLTFSGENEKAVAAAASSYHDFLRVHSSFFIMHAPQPALISRINRRYRYQLLLRVNKGRDGDASRLRAILQTVQEQYLRKSRSPSVSIAIDVDAQSMM